MLKWDDILGEREAEPAHTERHVRAGVGSGPTYIKTSAGKKSEVLSLRVIPMTIGIVSRSKSSV